MGLLPGLLPPLLSGSPVTSIINPGVGAGSVGSTMGGVGVGAFGVGTTMPGDGSGVGSSVTGGGVLPPDCITATIITLAMIPATTMPITVFVFIRSISFQHKY
jgi:hypothetical protein